jgi:ATP-binding cassette, subfamily C (CFTR/MRP), member 1
VSDVTFEMLSEICANDVVANFPNLFSSLTVFAIYSIEAHLKMAPPLTPEKAFSSFLIVGLLGSPVANLLATVPNLFGSAGSVTRIQQYLSGDDFDDKRVIIENGHLPVDAFDADMNGELLDSASITVSKLILRESTNDSTTPNAITFTGNRGTVTIIIGPIGCGKSTFLKYLLGDTTSNSGTIAVKTPFVAYCSQTPWLQNSTIREAIAGPIDYDEAWYKEIISICSLDQDLARMPLGDLTALGSKGLKISGGQKQRIVCLKSGINKVTLTII